MPDLPTGTVTFLFTDLEGSTRLWEEHPDAMRDALARHDEILHDAVAAHDGEVVKSTGDGLLAVFAVAPEAVAAALAAQRAVLAQAWPLPEPLRVRMGLHTGHAEVRAGDYFGTAVNRAARIMSVAHGGQVLVSTVTGGLVQETALDGVELLDLGEHRLRGLSRPERLFQVTAPGLEQSFPAVAALDAFPTNLPLQTTTFLGRSREVAELTGLLGGNRLVTLTGVGGVGKTRLALQVAADLLPSFPDGAWLVELAPVADPDAVPTAVAAVLEVPDAPGVPVDDAVVEHLRRRRALLVLDNCEHVLGRAAALAGAIVTRCPDVTLLATSREGLAVGGERIVAVPALEVPPEHATIGAAREVASVRLFAERAGAVRAGFALTPENVEGVVAICRRLDGVPLALELAAARVASLHPAQIAERLDERFRLLNAGQRTAVERHQTLQAAIDWSYDLLTPDEQAALDRLAVFAGGCMLETAEAVVGGDGIDSHEVVDLLGHLVQRSLVVADDAGSETRYRLLETIRQYAAQRLARSGGTEATRRRHADAFRSVAAEIGVGLRGPDEPVWFGRFETERENLRAALAFLVAAHEFEIAFGLVVDLAPILLSNTPDAVGAFAESTRNAAARAECTMPPSVTALAAEHLMQAGDFAGAIGMAEAAIDARGDPAVAEPLVDLVLLRSMLTGGRVPPGAVLRTARERFLTSSDAPIAIFGLVCVSTGFAFSDAFEECAAASAEALAIARRSDISPSALAMALTQRGWVTLSSHPDEARALLREATTWAGTGIGADMAEGQLFDLEARAGNRLACLDQGRRALDALERGQDRIIVSTLLSALARGFDALGRPEAGALLAGAAAGTSPVAEFDVGFVASLRPADGESGADLRARGAAMDKDSLLALVSAELDALDAELRSEGSRWARSLGGASRRDA